MDVIKVDTRRDTPLRIAEILCDSCGAGAAGDTAAAVLAYVAENFDVRDYDNIPLSLYRYSSAIARVLGGEKPARVVHTFGAASDWVRADIETARDTLRDYDCRIYVCKNTGAVYASLPATYLMTGFFNPASGGALALANRACFWSDVIGGAALNPWVWWIDRAVADVTAVDAVHGLGDGFRGMERVYWLDGMDVAAKLALLHSGFDGSEYLVRVDCWDMVAESVAALSDYPCLSDTYFGAAEYELIWDYVERAAVDIGRANGVLLDELVDFCSAAVGVLRDLDATYRWEVRADLSVDDSRALNRDAWRDALHLLAIAWVRGGCCRADVLAAARWAGAEDGDGRHYASDDFDSFTAWGLRGARDSATPEWFSGDDALTALLED